MKADLKVLSKMKLTEPQIEDLYAFTRQHFVEHYDLQTELVDHLANDIETQWQKQPKLSFEDAKNKAFKKFGVFGFMDAIEQRQKTMNKRYRYYLWRELKQWFKLPQIIATITLFVLIYFALASSYVKLFSISLYVFVALWCMVKGFILHRKFIKRRKMTNKKWLLEELIFKQAGYVSFLFLLHLQNIFILNDSVKSVYGLLFMSLLFTVLMLINYISFEVIPNKAEELLKDTYPQFSM
ncbi:hypothetical protein [Winogradskyella bathintestinalis]|uniref:Uncharacterized protein n=1 Tax=Winogradskyella bathintestinalis TaxID=3035208 RepID=A0ABT7ZRI7_9FLAO|nr:hypothetical protein [Winogradskyella bathintestinalis]MDN3491602.1 hypothetical protein [Winogradskyella bathintestinalis]